MTTLATTATATTTTTTITSMTMMMNATIFPTTNATAAPQWMYNFVAFRKRLFLQTIEPIIVLLLGPCEDDDEATTAETLHAPHTDLHHRRLNFVPSYVSDLKAYKETSMSFATLMMLFLCLSATFMSPPPPSPQARATALARGWILSLGTGLLLFVGRRNYQSHWLRFPHFHAVSSIDAAVYCQDVTLCLCRVVATQLYRRRTR
eukprot:scaffold1803_cov92-Amphora_coffeaeformis.AAC.8